MIDQGASQGSAGADVPEAEDGGQSVLKRLLRPLVSRFVEVEGVVVALHPHVALGPEIWCLMSVLHRKRAK